LNRFRKLGLDWRQQQGSSLLSALRDIAPPNLLLHEFLDYRAILDRKELHWGLRWQPGIRGVCGFAVRSRDCEDHLSGARVSLEEGSHMRMAARIRRIRLQRSVSLEEVNAKTGLSKSFMARVEKGREVPTLEMLDTVAEALDVPIHVFFYDIAESKAAPRLTPPPGLKKLAEERRRPATPILAAIRGRRVRPSGSI
jgi:transcriptional regulator with XRE-family HTH domain